MNIFDIQSLIAKRKLVSVQDIDPSNAYLQLGVYQPNMRKKGSGENAYPSYAIPLSEIVGGSVCDTPLPFKTGSVGEKVSFKKLSGSDPATHKDVILPGLLEITRENGGGGIYNIAVEGSFNSGISPENTTWNTQYVDPANTSWAPLWDLENRSYTNWRNAIESPEGQRVPPQYVGMPAVMKYDDGNIVRYWLIMFTQWDVGGFNEYGGFAYDRYEIFPSVEFTRPDNQAEIIDIVSPGVHIARRNGGGAIYNIVNEPYSEIGVSPRNTKWNSIYTDSRTGYNGFDDLSNLESRVYTDFVLALDYQVGNHVLSTDLIMWDMTTDLYYKVVFTDWTQGGNGGFTYTRTVIPQNCPIKLADGTVINTASTSGGGYTPSYKVYAATLTQTGTNPPVATVLENTLGATPTWYYDSQGIYYAESFGTFTAGKTVVVPGAVPTTAAILLQTSATLPDQVFIKTAKIDNAGLDDKLTDTFIEIRVYN